MNKMHITITLDFGQGYVVSLPESEARDICSQLNGLFSPSVSPLRLSPISNNGYEAPVKVEDQASPTEATGTLREDNHICSINCSCFRSHI